MSSPEHCSSTKTHLDRSGSVNDSSGPSQNTVKPPGLMKCYVRQIKEQEFLKEIWSAQQVPLTFEGTSKPSAAVQRTLAIRNADYQAVLQNFENEMNNLDIKCEFRIEALKKKLQNKIDTIHSQIQHLKSEICDITCLSDQKYREFKNVIELEMCEERRTIDEMFDDVKTVEVSRQSGATQIIKDYYKILRDSFYLQPKDLLQMMEKKILEYNQMALNNHKKYEDLKLKLRLSADTYKRNFYIWIKEMKKNRLAVCRQSALDDFYYEHGNFIKSGCKYMRSLEGKAALCRLRSRKTIISEIVTSWESTVPFRASRIEELSFLLNSGISSLNLAVIEFIKSYKIHMTKHLGRLHTKLEKLKTIIDTGESLEGQEKPIDEEFEVVEGIYEKEKEKYDQFIAHLEDIWREIITKFEEKSEEIFKPFRQFGSPWDEQSANFFKLQESIISQLSNRSVKSQLVHDDLQHKISTEVSILREEDNATKLEKRLIQIFSILDKKIQKHNSDYNEDFKIISKCKDIVTKEVHVWYNKIDKFLQSNKPAEIVIKTRTMSSVSVEGCDNSSCDLNLEDIILQEIPLIEDQIESLDEWKSKFLRNFSEYLPNFEKDIIDLVESWQQNLLLQASKCMEENVEAVEKLRRHIKEEIHDVRLNELLIHQCELEKHKKAISRLISESSICSYSFLDFSGDINDYELGILRILKEYGSNVKNTTQIICLQNMLKKLKKEFIGRMKIKINSNSERLTTRIGLLNHSNECFLNSIKLFSQGGNYSPEEIILAEKEFSILMEDIEKDESESRLKIKNSEDELNSQVQSIENSYFESLNITMTKLKIQEDIIAVMTRVEYLFEVRLTKLMDLNNKLSEEITNFIEKCLKKARLFEVTRAVNNLIQIVQTVSYFIKGPFPECDIPKDVKKNFTVLKKEPIDDKAKTKKTKDKNSKKQGSLKKSISAERASPAAMTEHKSDNRKNYVSSIMKLIQDALVIINDKAKIFYTEMIDKEEHPSLPSMNEACENCIENSLQQLNVIYVDASNFWLEQLDKLLQFFKTLELPALDWYLIDENISEENENSVTSFSTMTSNPQQVMSMKIDENFTKFQNTLQEMLDLLQSKNNNIYQQIGDNECKLMDATST